MGLSTGGRLMLSVWNEAMKLKHRGYDNRIGIVSLTYVLGIGGIQSHISYFTYTLYIQLVDIYGIFSFAVEYCAIIPNCTLLIGTHASHRMRYKVACHSWVEFLPFFNDGGGMMSNGIPQSQWCKGQGLPKSGTGHYGLWEKDNNQQRYIQLYSVKLCYHTKSYITIIYSGIFS